MAQLKKGESPKKQIKPKKYKEEELDLKLLKELKKADKNINYYKGEKDE